MTGQLQLEAFDEKFSKPNTDPGPRSAGLRVIYILTGILVFSITAIAIYAIGSHPTVDDVLRLGVPEADRFASYEKLRADWMSSVKDLTQMALVTVVLPLFASVIAAVIDSRTSSE